MGQNMIKQMEPAVVEQWKTKYAEKIEKALKPTGKLRGYALLGVGRK